MFSRSSRGRKALSELEQVIMDVVWSAGPGTLTAEDVRQSLAKRRRFKESTVRTMLRRLEEKGYLTHTVEGRTFLYRPVDARQGVAAQAVRQVIARFCNGSVEQLLIGMVDNDVVDRDELERLAKRIASAKKAKGEKT
jgi:predicted transcriptional regulator